MDGYCCGQEGFPVVVRVTADLKTEDTLLLNHYVVSRMFRVIPDVLHFVKYPPVQNKLQRLLNSPQSRASLLQ